MWKGEGGICNLARREKERGEVLTKCASTNNASKQDKGELRPYIQAAP